MSAPAAPTPTADDETSEDTGDGRALRRERNREAVVDALVALINEGNLEPSAKQIATRAGVSHRSVFRYFDDMNDLAETAVRREFAAAAKLASIPDGTGLPLDQRIDQLVTTRLELYRSVRWPATVARREGLKYPHIYEEMGGLADLLRREVSAYFADELDALGMETADAVVDAVLTLTSFDAWDHGHRVLRQDDDAIGRSWSTALGVLLGNAASR